MLNKKLLVTRFEPPPSDVWSEHFINCATTTVPASLTVGWGYEIGQIWETWKIVLKSEKAVMGLATKSDPPLSLLFPKLE